MYFQQNLPGNISYIHSDLVFTKVFEFSSMNAILYIKLSRKR